MTIVYLKEIDKYFTIIDTLEVKNFTIIKLKLAPNWIAINNKKQIIENCYVEFVIETETSIEEDLKETMYLQHAGIGGKSQSIILDVVKKDCIKQLKNYRYIVISIKNDT